MKKFNKKDYLIFTVAIGLVIAAMWYNQKIQEENQIYFPRPLSDDDIKKYSNHDLRTVIVFPFFTQKAYEKGGFYDYFNGTCKTCDTISLRPVVSNSTYTTGLSGFEYLTQLHYPFITDLTVDQHPEILNDYDKIILLHNEYVTKKEFDAISKHNNVVYLYPNSLYVEVSVNYNDWTMKLVKGHGYDNTKTPPYSIKTGIASGNGFGYVTSSKYEYDMNCKNYKWEQMPNGITPTCWPEFLIKADRNVLQVIKDYPDKIPKLIPMTNKTIPISKLPHCDEFGNCT